MARPKTRKDYDKVTNAEYPLLAFRTYGKKHKEELSERIEAVVKVVNKAIGGTDRKRKKQDIIIEALNRGLDLLETEAKRQK